MSCKTATAPINITSKASGPCQQKCNLAFSYQKSDTSVENMGDYLKLSYDEAAIAPVTFNTKKYTVSEVRIYQPSLHQFDGVRADGEIIVVHTSGSSTLLICVPIRVSNAMTPSSSTFKMIVPKIAKYAVNSGDSAKLNIDSFTLNSLVPVTSFYSYSGTFPYPPCNGKVNYVVFPLTYEGAAGITSEDMQLLKKTISDSPARISSNVDFYFNERGPTKEKGAADDIYIDCKPTGDDGEVIIPVESESTAKITLSKEQIKKWMSNPLIIILVGALLMFIILKLGRGLFEKISSVKKPNLSNIRVPRLRRST